MSYEQFANGAQTTLNGGIGDGDLSLVVASAGGFPTDAQYRIRIDQELLLVTAGAGTTTWTIERGAESTVAAAHSNGARVTHVLTRGALLSLLPVLLGAGTANALSFTNEIAGWPPYVPVNTDLHAGNLWWRKIGTPTTAPTPVLVSGEVGITPTFMYAMKCVTDAASEGFENLPWTYANEPRVKNGRYLSARCYIWCEGGVGVTMKLLNSDAGSTSAAKVSAAGWTLVEINAHILADTSCKLQFIADGAGTFYVARFCANLGNIALDLAPRPTKYVQVEAADSLSNADSGGAFVDLDLTAITSPLAFMVCGGGRFSNSVAAKGLYLRRNGSAVGLGTYSILAGWNDSATLYNPFTFECALDDGQVMEYGSDAAAANTEHIYLGIRGYWEYA